VRTRFLRQLEKLLSVLQKMLVCTGPPPLPTPLLGLDCRRHD